jgi:hypothetical protein
MVVLPDFSGATSLVMSSRGAPSIGARRREHATFSMTGECTWGGVGSGSRDRLDARLTTLG